ncbi:MAG: transcription termination/antitermination protein NusG [Arcanobacterium sp.]|nr:transcription termination/antitermination protein NusG [Arcanobacterium sp.]
MANDDEMLRTDDAIIDDVVLDDAVEGGAAEALAASDAEVSVVREESSPAEAAESADASVVEERADGDAKAEAEQVAPAETAQKTAEPTPETADMVRKKIKGLPGRWYVLHTYAGYEKRVKQDLEIRLHSMNMEDFIFQVEVPMEEVVEVRKGQNKLVSRVRMPGYALIRMDMTNESWRVVQETNGVTGFVGNGRNPVALSEDEVVDMLTPVIEQQVAHEAVAAGKPIPGGGPVLLTQYEVGETVTLTTEPWIGMPATISQIDPVNQRLTVLMTLVGQETPVELSFSQVQKMD